MKIRIIWVVIGLQALLISPVLAQDEAAEATPGDAAVTGEAVVDGEGEVEGEDVTMPNNGSIYIPFKPTFVVNYGGPGRLKYIKTDVSVRLQDGKTASSVRHHMPYIRNNLVMLFAAQTDESISSQAGKEALRNEALREVREVLKKEDHQEGVIDLYFTSFLVQK